MPDTEHMTDAAQREAALDPARSFIVQAPAGSGKTELLIQRYLTLLACVRAPEEVVAITFTRKAAGEMVKRVLQALARAQDAAEPAAAHESRTWRLARAVLARDAEREWNLVAHPTRMRIQTIDSLCAALTRQMPWLARFGAQPAIAESADAELLYRAAARATLAEVEAGRAWSDAIARLLMHRDNNLVQVETLLVDMLRRRDQWLRHVAGRRGDADAQRALLEGALGDAVCAELQALRATLPSEIVPRLLACARFAAANLVQQGSASPLVACLDLAALPAAEAAVLPVWRGLATLLLTDDGDWRKRLDKRVGFPPASAAADAAGKACNEAMKEACTGLLAELQDAAALRARLAAVRALPPARYADEQWEILRALFELLPLAVAQLRLVFQERGQVDFTEVAHAALRALGEAEAPTDLALTLDYRIHHLLVDEFQDTSFSQYELLKGLTAGWEHGDGRTLFVVGDPMQSIYRFREADVGLYLRALRAGIGGVKLVPLNLSVNFRSQAGIVDWVNRTFARVLPETGDVATGAVAYSPSQAHNPPGAGAAVQVHPLFDADAEIEAVEVAALVQAARARRTDARIAILVRARNHLAHILPALRRAGLRYRAIEIERLGHRPVVQDLLALTRALLHPADRVAWLAILRAPWCGLTLADLHALCGERPDAALWELLSDETQVEVMSPDGRTRARALREVMQTALAERRRMPLRRWVEGVWLALGGPACVDRTDLADALVALDLLDGLERGGDLPDFAAFEQRVAGLYALPDVTADESLQVMTIHKAKGLEFDTVIVPGLGRRPPSDTERLLMWIERPSAAPHGELLLAPIRESGSDGDPIYLYLKGIDQKKGRHEDGRLLYVAATRAQHELHLIGHVTVSEKNGEASVSTPAANTLLHRLWPIVAPEFQARLAARGVVSATAGDGTADPRRALPIQRLVAGWSLPPPPPDVAWAAGVDELEPEQEPVEFLWAGDTARHVGTVVHRGLRAIAESGLDGWDAERVAARQPRVRTVLAHLGVPAAELDAAAARVTTALTRTLGDARGRWILDAGQRDARNEFALTGVSDGRTVSVIIDRSFVDTDGTRWIIDYKAGAHEGPDLDAFLDREQERYRVQLERYAALMRGLDARPIRLGLYFPLLGGWREWSPPPG